MLETNLEITLNYRILDLRIADFSAYTINSWWNKVIKFFTEVKIDRCLFQAKEIKCCPHDN